jgi:uncharacterized protein (TIGR02598 family)
MTRQRRRCSSFSLVEVTLALGVAAVSLLVIFSLLPIGLQTNQRSIEQTAAADILSTVAADLRATSRTATSSSQFGISIPPNPMTSSATAPILYFNSVGQLVASDENPRYRLTITFPANGGGTKTATFTDLKITWPASAAVANAQGSAEMFAAFDRN